MHIVDRKETAKEFIKHLPTNAVFVYKDEVYVKVYEKTNDNKCLVRYVNLTKGEIPSAKESEEFEYTLGTRVEATLILTNRKEVEKWD